MQVVLLLNKVEISRNILFQKEPKYTKIKRKRNI